MVTANVRLMRLIGRGAMGEVWLAEHEGLKTHVAVKFVLERQGDDDTEALERFAQEAALAAQIKSAHVVQKFDHGVMDDGTPYIVMEYLEGEQLGDLLSRQAKLPLAQVLNIVSQTAKALQSAHKQGVVHRDIKPDNIFLSTRDDELHIKVFDFGVAKKTVVDAPEPGTIPREAQLGITNDGVMVGTPEYMSPEQVMSAKKVDHSADLWALAVVAYVALTGELPFKGKDVGALCVHLLEGDFTPPSTLASELPPELDAWFESAFAKNRDDRFQTAREMAVSMSRLVPGTSGDALMSGGYDALPSTSGGRAPLISHQDIAVRGARAATFSGSSSDALLAFTHRRRTSLIAAAVGVALLGAAFTAVMMIGDDETTASPDPAAAAAATDATAPEAAVADDGTAETDGSGDEAADDGITAQADDASSANPAASSAAAAAASASATPPRLRPYRPRGKRWMDKRRPAAKPKDPGF
jgi:serine/threonine protein kinase